MIDASPLCAECRARPLGWPRCLACDPARQRKLEKRRVKRSRYREKRAVARAQRDLARSIDRYFIWQRDKHKCVYCARHVSQHAMTVDHVVPLSRGGDDALDNLVTCCQVCNGAKGSMTVDEFRATLTVWRAFATEFCGK